VKMKNFTGKTLRWEWREGVIELTLDHAPANEIGTAMLAELERFVASFGALALETSPRAEICVSFMRPPRQFAQRIALQACVLFSSTSTP